MFACRGVDDRESRCPPAACGGSGSLDTQGGAKFQGGRPLKATPRLRVKSREIRKFAVIQGEVMSSRIMCIRIPKPLAAALTAFCATWGEQPSTVVRSGLMDLLEHPERYPAIVAARRACAFE